MSRTVYVHGRIDLNALPPATLTSVAKALAMLDAAGRSGVIEWVNTAGPPRRRRSDAHGPGEQPLQPQETAILQDLSICRRYPKHKWTTAEVLAAKLDIPVASTRIRLKKLFDAGHLQRRLMPRAPSDRGKQRYEYAHLASKQKS